MVMNLNANVGFQFLDVSMPVMNGNVESSVGSNAFSTRWNANLGLDPSPEIRSSEIAFWAKGSSSRKIIPRTFFLGRTKIERCQGIPASPWPDPQGPGPGPTVGWAQIIKNVPKFDRESMVSLKH